MNKEKDNGSTDAPVTRPFDDEFKADIIRPKKRFVRYKEGAALYGMGLKTFERLAREAKATYKIDRMVLVNCEYFEAYLEQFRIADIDCD